MAETCTLLPRCSEGLGYEKSLKREFIEIPKPVYFTLLKKSDNDKLKQAALQSFNTYLYEAGLDVDCLKEKTQQCEIALKRSESHMVRILRQNHHIIKSVKSDSPSTMEMNEMKKAMPNEKQSINDKQDHSSDKTLSTGSGSASVMGDLNSRAESDQSVLDIGRDPVKRTYSYSRTDSNYVANSETDEFVSADEAIDGDEQVNVTDESAKTVDTRETSEPPEPSPALSAAERVPEQHGTVLCEELESVESACCTIVPKKTVMDAAVQTNEECPTIIFPGVSRIIFEKVVNENVKLQKVISRTESNGHKTLLEKTESAQIIAGLREQLKVEHEENIQLKQTLNDSNSEQKRAAAENIDKVSKLEKKDGLSQVMLEQFRELCNSLEIQNRQLQTRLLKVESQEGVVAQDKETERDSAKMAKLEQALVQEKKSNDAWRNLFEKINAQLKEKDGKIKELDAQIKQSQDDNYFLKTQLKEFQDNYDELLKEQKKKDRHLRKLQDMLNEAHMRNIQGSRKEKAKHHYKGADCADGAGFLSSPPGGFSQATVLKCPRCHLHFQDDLEYNVHCSKCIDD